MTLMRTSLALLVADGVRARRRAGRIRPTVSPRVADERGVTHLIDLIGADSIGTG
jgi:hypothetical protein